MDNNAQNKIDIQFLLHNGWLEYTRESMTPPMCYYKNSYPLALWWDEQHEVFFVIDFNSINNSEILSSDQFISTVKEYDALIMPILEEIKNRSQDKSK